MKYHNLPVPDQRRYLCPLYPTSWDSTGRLWDVASGEELYVLSEHTGPVWGAAFSPDGMLAATGSIDGTVKLWDVATGTALLTLSNDDGINSVDFSPDGRRLLSGSSDGMLREYILPLDELSELAKTRLTRGLTDEECRQYLHLEACPQ